MEQPGVNISRKTVSFGRVRYCRLRAFLSKSSITRAQLTWEAECTVAGTREELEIGTAQGKHQGRFGNYVYMSNSAFTSGCALIKP
jgi:hypothetical protein